MRTPDMTNYQHLWTPEEDALLGTATDAVVANQLGRSRGAVKARRFALKIAPSPRKNAEPATPLAGRIKQARLAASITQAKAAERAGCDIRLWEKYEAGDVAPSVLRLAAVARALGVSTDSLLA